MNNIFKMLLLSCIPAAAMAPACALQWSGPPTDTTTESPYDQPAEGVDSPAESACPSGQRLCEGVCKDIETDASNCGDCGIVCTAGLNAQPACISAICGVTCDPGWSDQDGDGSCETPCTPTAAEEICNGADDDCSGVCDDGIGMACCAGAAGGCTTSCGSMGSRTCLDTCVWGSCGPPAEACDGSDEDCDTVCDNGWECCAGDTGSCPLPCGSMGTRTCSASCAWGGCATAPEICNGNDDDCDGLCDNGFPCCAAATLGCTTSCGSEGTMTCSGSCSWGSCETGPEICNGLDDNCDGDVDEGFRAQELVVTYGQMSSFNSTCNGTTERFGINCNDAIHRYCRSLGCPQSGFGPGENSDTLNIVCTAGGSLMTATYSTLQAHHPDCNSTKPISDSCYCAYNRYCRSLGYDGGFGPTSTTMGGVTLVCVSGGEMHFTTFTELSGYHAPCDGVTQVVGADCNAAIRRYCIANGHTGGFGPVEHTGEGDVVVICVSP